jgi:hypothetical protein
MRTDVRVEKTKCSYNYDYCELVIFLNEKDNVFIDKDAVIMDRNYEIYNFPNNIRVIENQYSFKDLVDFKKIMIIEGKLSYSGRVILPFEIGLLGLVYYYYSQKEISQILKKSIINIYRKIAREIIHSENPLMIQRFLTVYGFGFPLITCSKNSVKVSLYYAPYSRFPPYFTAWIIEGLIDSTYKRNHKLIDFKFNPYSVSYDFNFIY